MGSIPLPALDLKTPPPPAGPMDQYAQLMKLRAAQQQQQAGALELQQRQQQMADQKAITQAMMNWDGKNPDVLPHQVIANGGSGSAALQVSQHILQQKQAAATLSKDQQAVVQEKLNHFIPALDNVLSLPPEQQPAAYEAAKADAVNKGYLDPQQAQQMQYQGPDALKLTRNEMVGQSGLLEQALKTAQTQQAVAKAGEAQANTQKVPSEIARNTAQANLAATENANFGQVTPKDRFVQSQENMRAQLGRQAQNANELQRQGLGNLEKQSEDYTKFLSSANTLKSSLQAAGNGNEMAAAIAPLQGTLFITTTEGVKRINETELQGVSGAGSLVQRINGALGKMTGSGPLSPQLKSDMSKLVDLYTQSKYQNYSNQAQYTMRLHGIDASKTPVLNSDGTIGGGNGQGGEVGPGGIIIHRDANGRIAKVE